MFNTLQRHSPLPLQRLLLGILFSTLISTLAGQFVEALQQTFAFLLEFREICQGLHRHVAATAAHELRREHAQVIYQDAEFLALRGSEVHRSRHLKDLTAFVTYLIALCSIM